MIWQTISERIIFDVPCQVLNICLETRAIEKAAFQMVNLYLVNMLWHYSRDFRGQYCNSPDKALDIQRKSLYTTNTYNTMESVGSHVPRIRFYVYGRPNLLQSPLLYSGPHSKLWSFQDTQQMIFYGIPKSGMYYLQNLKRPESDVPLSQCFRGTVRYNNILFTLEQKSEHAEDSKKLTLAGPEFQRIYLLSYSVQVSLLWHPENLQLLLHKSSQDDDINIVEQYYGQQKIKIIKFPSEYVVK